MFIDLYKGSNKTVRRPQKADTILQGDPNHLSNQLFFFNVSVCLLNFVVNMVAILVVLPIWPPLIFLVSLSKQKDAQSSLYLIQISGFCCSNYFEFQRPLRDTLIRSAHDPDAIAILLSMILAGSYGENIWQTVQ